MLEQVHRHPAAASTALLVICSALFLLPSSPAGANPLPAPFGVGFHMQSSTLLNCSVDPVTQCSQISQYCPDIGALAVDIYLYLLPGSITEFPFSQLVQDLHWEGAWSPSQFESCLDGSSEWEPAPDGVHIELQPSQPVMVTADPVRVGRLYLFAESPGHLDTWTNVLADGEACIPLPAAAGEPCYSVVSCASWFPLCHASFHPSALQLTVEQGNQTEGSLDAWVTATCTTSFVDDQPWMDLSVAYVEPGVRRISASINAADLPVGVYDGLIVAVTEATHTCAAVQLTVIPPICGLPEAGAETRRSTWSQIKHTYR